MGGLVGESLANRGWWWTELAVGFKRLQFRQSFAFRISTGVKGIENTKRGQQGKKLKWNAMEIDRKSYKTYYAHQRSLQQLLEIE